MNRILILLIFIASFSACDNNSSTDSNVQPIDLVGFEVQELPGGFQRVTKNDVNGKTLEEGVMKNGMRNGTWVIYQEKKPMPTKIANFIDDKYSGVFMEFSNTGQLELICHYKENLLHGKFTRIKNTRLLEEGSYVDGEIDGVFRKYYPNKSTMQQETNYKLGKLHGSSKYFNEEGQVIMEYEYKDGEKVSGGAVEPTDSE